MNFEEFKKGFERLCKLLGGEFTEESRSGRIHLNCYDIPKGRRVGVGVYKTKTIGLVLHMLEEDLELKVFGLRKSVGMGQVRE